MHVANDCTAATNFSIGLYSKTYMNTSVYSRVNVIPAGLVQSICTRLVGAVGLASVKQKLLLTYYTGYACEKKKTRFGAVCGPKKVQFATFCDFSRTILPSCAQQHVWQGRLRVGWLTARIIQCHVSCIHGAERLGDARIQYTLMPQPLSSLNISI